MFLSLFNFILALTIQAINPHATILFAGDAMQHQGQLDAARQADGSYSYDECFAPLRSIIEQADYAVVNLETPLGGKPYRGYPCFSAPDSYAIALRDAGFDLFLTANNHTLDCRDRGLTRTVSVLDTIGVKHLGTYTNARQRSERLPMIVNIKGFKVGFLNYTYGTNGFEVHQPAIVDYIDRATIKHDIEATRQAGAEIVCVALHWGEEYQLLPNASQKSLAKYLKEQGVDIIFGGHPHVIQPMALEPNQATGKNTALFYSLGNFISNMMTRDTRGGAIAKVLLRRDNTGRAYVDSLSYHLIFTLPPEGRWHNFAVYSADSLPQCSRLSQRNDFAYTARNIFRRHNINVTEF
jgi:poly-gamma-glutamate synthesis protein (capsule biosynthesis protein)